MPEPAYPDLHLFIGGRRIGASERDSLASTNPATGQVLGHIPRATEEDIDAALKAATEAFALWSEMPAVQRSKLLVKVAEGLRARKEELAQTITLDLGKPIAESRAEVDTAVGIWQWNAEEARRIYGRVIPERSSGALLYAVREPLGPIAGFSTWNAPLITPSRKISSVLAAGCTIVAKSASETPSPSSVLLEVILDAGVPPGVANLLFGSGAQISAKLLESPEIQGITFTGSTQLGRTLASQAVQGMKRAT
ncbi:MAG: aldehyde dehydrogenase family protein, partial [Arenibacterium sp.]